MRPCGLNTGAVAILFNKSVYFKIHHKILDPLGRYVILKVEIEDEPFVLINLHAPNKDKDSVKS